MIPFQKKQQQSLSSEREKTEAEDTRNSGEDEKKRLAKVGQEILMAACQTVQGFDLSH